MFAHLMLALLGAVMLASSLLVKIVGLPTQIRENFRLKSSPRGMRWLVRLGLVSYSSQTLWFCIRGDWLAVLAQAPGVVATGILLAQMLHYRAAGLAGLPALDVPEEPAPLAAAELQHGG